MYVTHMGPRRPGRLWQTVACWMFVSWCLGIVSQGQLWAWSCLKVKRSVPLAARVVWRNLVVWKMGGMYICTVISVCDSLVSQSASSRFKTNLHRLCIISRRPLIGRICPSVRPFNGLAIKSWHGQPHLLCLHYCSVGRGLVGPISGPLQGCCMRDGREDQKCLSITLTPGPHHRR